jgi:hypothetical protein
MQYMLLIYQDDANVTQGDKAAMAKVYQVFNQDLKQRGHYISNHGLKPATTATTLKVRDGKTATTDGPFTETREQLGGYYVVEAKDLDEAIAIAERIPSACWGSVEIRPVWS